MRNKIIIIGAGKIGTTIFNFLSIFDSLDLTLADTNKDSLSDINSANNSNTHRRTLLLENNCNFDSLFQQHNFQAVINAGPFSLSIPLAQAAFDRELSYFDLTEDVQSCKFIQALTKSSSSQHVFVPQCGLAPGFISILARYLYGQFDRLENVQLRVGALPQFPTNQMLYNLTWSTAGLVNEYCNLCQGIEQGELVNQAPLENKELFSLEGVEYEAFNTSGGLGTLTQTLAGKVEQLNYKTVRYPGHRDLIKFLLRDLKFQHEDKRESLVQLLDNSIPMTAQDMVLIMVTVSGDVKQTQNGMKHYQQLTELRRIYHQNIELPDQKPQEYSAIQICTAASLCAVLELWLNNRLPNTGFVRQENISLELFYQTHYGQYLMP